MRRPALLLLLLLTLLPASGRADRRSMVDVRTFHSEVMGTRFDLTIPGTIGAEEAAEAVFAIFDDIDARMSEWKETSPLSHVNREAGLARVEVPDDLRALIRRGIAMGEASGGAFDITWAALWGLWDFKAEHPKVPAAAEIERRTALVDYRQVEVIDDDKTVFLRLPGMKMGLGGIAKGWALDRAAEELRGRGFNDFLLSGGGQVMASGSKLDQGHWRVAIRDPRGAADDWFAYLDVNEASVSTSGDYERFFMVDGVRYHHILDPRTGQPARGLRSVTTISSNATLADAMSTAIFVMGVERGMALVQAQDDLEAVLVDDTGHVHVSAGLKDRLVIVHLPAE